MRAPERRIPLEQSPDGAKEQSRNVARVTTEITRDIYPMLVYRLGGGGGTSIPWSTGDVPLYRVSF